MVDDRTGTPHNALGQAVGAPERHDGVQPTGCLLMRWSRFLAIPNFHPAGA